MTEDKQRDRPEARAAFAVTAFETLVAVVFAPAIRNGERQRPAPYTVTAGVARPVEGRRVRISR